MKSVSAAALLLLLSLVPAVAEDTACVASPTRVCVLGMAAEASEAAGKTLSTSNTDSEANERFTLVAGIWGDIFKTAAMADDPDLALSAAPAVTKQFGTLGIPELITALKLAGRDADLAALLKQLEMDDRIADMVFGPALVAAGRTGDFKTFIASRNYQPADVTAMEAAGDFLAGRPQDGLALIDALHGSFKEAARVNALYFVLSAGRGDIAVPLVAYQDLETVNGVEACALVAQAAKDKALAQQCLAAASPLPEAAARDGAYLYAVAPQLVGALAAVGDWQEALAILKQLTPDNQMLAAEKLARFSHAPEMLPAARKAFGSPGPQARKRGGYLVRMLVLAGQADEAATFVATAPDAVTQDFWRGQQAGALAEMGDTATALPLAVQIADPVAKAFALCAVAKALKV